MIPLCAQGVVLHIGTNQDVMRVKNDIISGKTERSTVAKETT
jgi:hypothetical protein